MCSAAIPVYFSGFVQIIEKNSESNDRYESNSFIYKSSYSGLNRNCAYSIGVLAEKSQSMFSNNISSFIQSTLIKHS